MRATAASTTKLPIFGKSRLLTCAQSVSVRTGHAGVLVESNFAVINASSMRLERARYRNVVAIRGAADGDIVAPRAMTTTEPPEHGALAAIGDALRGAGLTARALAAWAG